MLSQSQLVMKEGNPQEKLLFQSAKRTLYHEKLLCQIEKQQYTYGTQTKQHIKQLKHEIVLLKTSMGEMDTIYDTCNTTLQQHIANIQIQCDKLTTRITQMETTMDNEYVDISERLHTLESQQQQHEDIQTQLEEYKQKLEITTNEKHNMEQTLIQIKKQLKNIRYSCIAMRWNSADKTSNVIVSVDGLTASSTSTDTAEIITGTSQLIPNTGTHKIHATLDEFDTDGSVLIGMIPSIFTAKTILWQGFETHPGWSLCLAKNCVDVIHNSKPVKQGQTKSGDNIVITWDSNIGTLTFHHNGIPIGPKYSVEQAVILTLVLYSPAGRQTIRLNPMPTA